MVGRYRVRGNVELTGGVKRKGSRKWFRRRRVRGIANDDVVKRERLKFRECDIGISGDMGVRDRKGGDVRRKDRVGGDMTRKDGVRRDVMSKNSIVSDRGKAI